MRKNIQTNTHQFIIEEQLNDFIVITAICEATGLSYRSGVHKLIKINTSTIVSAFNKDNQQIKYYLTEKEESIILSIRVQFEFLPLILEEIILKKLIKSQEHRQIQYSQILGEIQQLEKKLDQISFSIKIYQKMQAIYGINDIFSHNLQRGDYLLEFSGFISSSSNYDSENIEGIQSGYFSFIIIEQSKKNNSEKRVNLSFTSCEEYEKPVAWTDLVSIKQSTKVVIKIQNNSESWISNSLLVVTKVK